jgi:hypothetical protein
MKKLMWVMVGLIMGGAGLLSSATAEEMSNHELTQRVHQLEEKLKIEGEGAPAEWTDRVTVSGAVEVEAGFTSTDPVEGEGSDDSDFALSTVELGIGAKIVDHVSGDVLFLYEDGEDIVVDEAFITIDGGDVVPLYLRAGELYVPFGNFETHMISDPLTLEIAEMREAALQIGTEAGGFYGSAFIFNGDVDEIDADDDHVDNFGANAGFGLESDAFSVDVGVSYLNNLIDADGWEGAIADEELALNEYVAGVGAYAIVSFGPLTFIGEYVSALDDIQWVDGDDNLIDEDHIAAWNVEIGFGFALGAKEATLAVAYQGTDNAQSRLPETRYLGSVGVSIFENTTVALEYLMDEFENDDDAQALTAQLAIEF